MFFDRCLHVVMTLLDFHIHGVHIKRGFVSAKFWFNVKCWINWGKFCWRRR
jgi:hypothetical protein